LVDHPVSSLVAHGGFLSSPYNTIHVGSLGGNRSSPQRIIGICMGSKEFHVLWTFGERFTTVLEFPLNENVTSLLLPYLDIRIATSIKS